MGLNESGLGAWFNDIRQAVDGQVVDNIVAEQKRLAPFKTGQLRESIQKIRVGPDTWRIIVTAPYWAPLEYGAGPHAIPNAFGYGKNFGTSPTFHPGNRAYMFMRRPLMKIRSFA